MKIAFEIPVLYLEEISQVTDFDYALAHLVLQDPAYRAFYKKQSLRGREVFLDNSVNELKTPLLASAVLEAAELINPTYVIAPDFVNDMEKTLAELNAFRKTFSKAIIAVTQGRNLSECLSCYNQICSYDEVSLVGIPYTLASCDGKDSHRAAIMRQRLVNEIKVLNKKPVHLLGLTDPTELFSYRGDSFVRSIDTSSPILCGSVGIRYPVEEIGFEKVFPDENYFYRTLTVERLKDIYYNIAMLRRYVND